MKTLQHMDSHEMSVVEHMQYCDASWFCKWFSKLLFDPVNVMELVYMLKCP